MSSAFIREATASHYGYGYRRLPAKQASPASPMGVGAHARRKRTVRRQRPLFAAFTGSGQRL